MDIQKTIGRSLSRRGFIAGAGTAAAASLVGCSDDGPTTPTPPTTPTTPTITDADILNFALNLEYLEAEFYLRAATGSGLSATDAGGTSAGSVAGGTQVMFGSTALANYANEIAQDELNHVRFLRSALTSAGATPVVRPQIDFTNAFSALAVAAGIVPAGGTFNPFSSQNAFLVGAFVFEDVGVTAYSGAAPLLTSKSILSAAAGIQAVEAYHAAEIRTLLVGMAATSNDQTYVGYANKVSTLRGMLGGGNETMLSSSTIVAADTTNAIGFSRSTDQVLHIVYAMGAGVQTKGGFFPAGLNGTITATAS
ncbi:MAG: ferritin-like domain-containing protein [Acidobacteria bacterium]|nr:ferritin-like domain-containing protein [Acidobacteriota bacterium]